MSAVRNSVYIAIIISLAWTIPVRSEPSIHQVKLPSGRLGQIISFDADHVVCETDKGKEVCGWLDLDFSLSSNIETNASLRIEQRRIKNKSETGTRTLISIKTEGNKWQCYLIDDYHVDPETRIKRKSQSQYTAYLGPAYFINSNTVVITPNYELIAFRDYNHDGTDEMFRAWRSTITQNGQLSPASSKVPPRWICTFEAWGKPYFFNFDQNTFPMIPEPSTKSGFVCWDNIEYSLENLLIKDSDGLIRYPIKKANHRMDPTAPTPTESGKAQSTAGGL